MNTAEDTIEDRFDILKDWIPNDVKRRTEQVPDTKRRVISHEKDISTKKW